jgi:hypothetical protein
MWIHHLLCQNLDLCCNLTLCIHHLLCWNPDLCCSLSCASIKLFVLESRSVLQLELCIHQVVCVGIQIFATNFSTSSFVLDSRSLLQLQCISSFVLELRLQQLQCIILLCYNPHLTNYGGQFAVQ